jgi:hypothetical protein
MEKMQVNIKNLVLDGLDTYEVNKYFKIKNNSNLDGIIIECISPDTIEYEYEQHYNSYFRNALELALPKAFISPYCIDEIKNIHWKGRILFCYYGKTEYINNNMYKITVDDISKVKQWHDILIEYYTSTLKYKDAKFTSWDVAYNEYLDAVSCDYLEQAFLHLITALEALLLEGNNELTYRVSLNTAMLCGEGIDDRKEIFNFIKNSYNLRSSVVHGDINAIRKKFSNEKLYDSLFELRHIVSKSLFATYNKDKNKIIEHIENLILS